MSIFNDTLISFFHLENIGLFLAFALIGLGVLVILWMFTRYRRIRNALTQFKAIVNESTDTQSFTEGYETYRSKAVEIPGVRHAWIEFEETLIPPLDDIDDPNYRVYRNTKRPSDYFSTTAIHHFQLRPLIQPHTFVGLGLLFTFLGLVAALTETGAAFANANADELQRALKSLLEIAGTKFWASVGGLLTSILVGAAVSGFSASIRKNLHIICDLLEERLLYANLERIAVDQYGHSQRQTRRLEEMSTEITVALGNRISDAISELPPMLSSSLGDTMKPITEELTKVTDKLGSENLSAIEKMTDSFANKITGSSGDAMNNVTHQLEALVKTLESTASQLSGGGNNLSTGLEQAIAGINATMMDVAKQLKETTSQAGDQFKADAGEASSGLKEVISEMRSQQQGSVEQMRTMTEALNEMSTKVSRSVEELIERSGTELSESIKGSVKGTSETVENALRSLGDVIEGRVTTATETAQNSFTSSFASLQQQLNDTSEGLTNSINGWRTHLNEISARFEAISGQLAIQVGAISNVNEQVGQSGLVFQQSARAVQEASAPLTQASRQLDQSMTQMSGLMESTLNETRTASAAMEEHLKIMAGSVAALQSAWERNGQHLTNVDTELENAFRQVSKHLSDSLSQLSTFASELDTNLSDSVGKLSGFVLEVSELVEELSESQRPRH
ncbi:methyl-accepting chemotaxis protein [Marinobacterium sp. MBR-111]|jgi:methyl-accepting chemotaxis protein|uniref:anti-phage ZorAB system protein ZorA n=1 Tax=Marinobacterium sp. MBR-111 TaxID=3156463 RepID=UPI003391C586